MAPALTSTATHRSLAASSLTSSKPTSQAPSSIRAWSVPTSGRRLSSRQRASCSSVGTEQASGSTSRSKDSGTKSAGWRQDRASHQTAWLHQVRGITNLAPFPPVDALRLTRKVQMVGLGGIEATCRSVGRAKSNNRTSCDKTSQTSHTQLPVTSDSCDKTSQTSHTLLPVTSDRLLQ